MKRKAILSVCFILLISLFSLVSCVDVFTPTKTDTGASDIMSDSEGSIPKDTDDTEDTAPSSEQEKPSTDSTAQSTVPPITDSSASSDDTDEGDVGYFVAEVLTNGNVIPNPYTAGEDAPNGLEGLFYSAKTPGGTPTDKGDGSVWLTLTPVNNYYVVNVTINGECDGYESLENDVYRVYGVASDLTINVTTEKLPTSSRDIFEKYGYGITEDGTMVVSWKQSEYDPFRYVELTYTDSKGEYHRDYVDAALGSASLFQMVEGRVYTVDMRAIGYFDMGAKVQVTGCYMDEPRDVAFPRIEITTEDFVWPSCDFVSSPEGCWGAGITNAFYEQCVVTVYNASNEVVYASSSNMSDGQEYLGAKMKIRGNTSARYASHGRYPYKIKLDKKFDLLYPLIGRADDGKEYADKDWLLLNYGADGYRICGDAIADAVGTEWSPDYCYVSLYVNGEYRGLYVLSEAVEEGSGQGEEQWRVAVDEDGYVFECDAYWWNEDLYFRTPLTAGTPMYFTFKYPDADDMDENSPELIYLREYITKFEEALMRDDDSYLDYIDLDSFVRWLLVADYLSIKDGGGCNLFLYKRDSTDGTKIAMGPNWDFDSYMGGVESLSVIRMTWNGAPFYYQYLINKESFHKRYCELFEETYKTLEAYIEASFSEIDMSAHNQLLSYDNKRFGTSTTSLLTRKERFLSFLSEHIEWMKTQFRQ